MFSNRRYCRLRIVPESLSSNSFVSGIFKNTGGIEFKEDTGIDFVVEESPTGFGNKASITIYGLDAKTIEYLTHSVTTFLPVNEKYRIVLEAGTYDRHSVIFNGVSMNVNTNVDNANYSISIEANGSYDVDRESHTIFFTGKKDLGLELSKYFSLKGYSVVNKLSPFEVDNFYVKDMNLREICTYIATQFRVSMSYFYDEKIIFLTKDGIESGDTITPFVLSETENNMIGSPTPLLAKKAKATMLLNNSITNPVYNGKVRIISKKFPSLSSELLNLVEIKHIGQTRGTDWKTEIGLAANNYGVRN